MNKTESPKVSIITLNYNQKEVTGEFLKSCKELDYNNYEIIVIDNNSKENPEDYFKNIYPEAIIIVSDENLGFTGGNNLGMRHADGDFLFIVNNDTEVTPALLTNLLKPFKLDSTIGMVSPKIYYFESPKTIQYAGYTEINPFTGRNRAIGSKELDEGQHEISGYTNYAHGAAMLVKREVIEKVGMFPEEFFIYYEELDWSAHTTRAGFKIYYAADAVIYHKESITMGKESSIKAYYHTRNRIHFMRRNFEGWKFFLFVMFFTFLTAPKSILKYSFKGQNEHLKSFWKAIIWNITYKK